MNVNLFRAATDGDLKLLDDCSGDENAVKALKSNKTHQKNNVLHIAARHGNSGFVQKTLDVVPELYNQLNFNNDTPLHVAATHGHLAVAEILVDHSILYRQELAEAQEEEVLPPVLCQMTNSDGSTALHEALKNGHEDVSLYLLDKDGDLVCTCNDADESALYLAAESLCEQVMAKILNSELSYSVKGPHGLNVLHAAKHCSEATVTLLLSKRPDLMKHPDESGRTALHYAVQGYCRKFIEQVLMEDASIACIPDNDGLTPLLTASSMGSWGICEDIIKFAPESIESRDKNGKNALHLFKPWSYLQNVRFLKIKGVRELINERDYDGNIPLHLAIKSRDHTKSLRLIRHTNLKAVNKSGQTILDFCESDWTFSNKLRGLGIQMIRSNASRGRYPDKNGFPNAFPRNSFFSIKKDKDWRDMANTLSVVAALLVTVTFSAIFTMPGGYNSDEDSKNFGIANLVRKAALQVFILSDTVAMCSSLIVVFMSIWARVGDKDTLRGMTSICLGVIKVALCTTLVAFATGLYAVTAHRVLWIAIFVCVVCGMVPFLFLKNNWLLQISVKGTDRLQVTRKHHDNQDMDGNDKWIEDEDSEELEEEADCAEAEAVVGGGNEQIPITRSLTAYL